MTNEREQNVVFPVESEKRLIRGHKIRGGPKETPLLMRRRIAQFKSWVNGKLT